VEPSERITFIEPRDIGLSLCAALISGVVQKDQTDAFSSSRPSTNDRPVYMCYGAVFFTL
jgi:hypothetical protein